MNQKLLIAGIAVLAVAIAGAYFLFFQPPAHDDDYHAHADFAVFINDQKFNFSQKDFMSEALCGKPGEADEHEHADLDTLEGLKSVVHLHDLNGNVIHFHNERVTLPMFFKSIGFNLNETCFSTRDASYCNGEGNTLKVFVNGIRVEGGLENYAPADLDKILVTYGTETDFSTQQDSITAQACIYSEKCAKPDGFVITPESCGS